MPFFQTGAAAASGGMLRDKTWMAAHGSLTSVMEGFRGNKTLQNEAAALMFRIIPSAFRNHPQFRLPQLKTGTESGADKTRFQGYPSGRFSHDILLFPSGCSSPEDFRGTMSGNSGNASVPE